MRYKLQHKAYWLTHLNEKWTRTLVMLAVVLNLHSASANKGIISSNQMDSEQEVN
jgi:hypothetical protein